MVDGTRATDGLLDMTASTEIFEDSIMSLDDAMFVPGALIFDQLKSRAVNFGVPGAPSIRIRFPDLPHLGVWTRPGAGVPVHRALAGLCSSPGICR